MTAGDRFTTYIMLDGETKYVQGTLLALSRIGDRVWCVSLGKDLTETNGQVLMREKDMLPAYSEPQLGVI